MEERRRNKRMELEAKIIVKRLDGAQGQTVEIEAFDLSKTGIGFYCEETLNVGSMYEAYLTIWTKEVIHCFIEIVRAVKKDGRFAYGGVFIGMPESDMQRIGVYETIQDMNETNNNE